MFSAERDWNIFNSWSAAGHKMGSYFMYGDITLKILKISWKNLVGNLKKCGCFKSRNRTDDEILDQFRLLGNCPSTSKPTLAVVSLGLLLTIVKSSLGTGHFLCGGVGGIFFVLA